MKYLIGFFVGVATVSALASALAEDLPMRTSTGITEMFAAIRTEGRIVLQAGVKPDGKAAVIPLDEEGRVICSR